ncbi:extensin family protein [Loktanella agnita]|uniref:extensin-like domain-containing protein n=1 Tax=Loktanella agnita TaxID=287097 RepID=UPI003986D3EB
MRHSKRQEMAQRAAKDRAKKPSRTRRVFHLAGTLLFAAALGYGGYQALTHPDTPLPPEWNPTQPLLVTHPVTPLTAWKLDRAAADMQSCVAALGDTARLQQRSDLEESAQCHMRDRVALSRVGQARIRDIETRCAIALRLAMWEHHSLQPAARDLLGSSVTGITHIGSYSCRKLRNSRGESTRMSSHATADAIDITGFQLADGRRLRLLSDWDGAPDQAAFLRRVRDDACTWFNLTLSPDYNRLHADHFHLQSTGWGFCR